MTDGRQAAQQLFAESFDAQPTHLVRAPGRVNVIGEHTDYNDGFVLPAAIDREVWIALLPTDDDTVEAVSDAFDEPAAFQLGDWDNKAQGWAAYLQGVAWALMQTGSAVAGWRGAVVSDIPVGAGLSSSAALELATARAFAAIAGADWDPVAAAKVCQRAENGWVGVNSGIMDQLSSAAGVAGAALLLDCRSMDYEAVPLPEGAALVVLDTSTRRELGSSGYNDRRQQCDEAAQLLGVAALRDASQPLLDQHAQELGDLLLRRARHVVTENERTLAAADAMRSGDGDRLGHLMAASHRSLRDDFEVSGHELNAIVDVASVTNGCYGARMTGGGFAGCAVALVDRAFVDFFLEDVTAAYRNQTGLDAELHVCVPVAGASDETPR
jgi:galactokinase